LEVAYNPNALTKVEGTAFPRLRKFPSSNPYFAALLRQREGCETMPWHRLPSSLILKPHVVADLGL
jgi:hypothetical protein